jgi:hypothetical protein
MKHLIKKLREAKLRVDEFNAIAIPKIQTPTFKISFAQLKAQGTASLTDNLTADQAEVTRLEGELEDLKTVGPGGRKAGTTKSIEAAATALELAKQQVNTDLTNISDRAASDADKAKTDADKAKSDAAAAAQTRINTLKRIADNAGNVGKAEDALIAALKQQVVKAKGNAADLNAALSALDAERKNQAAAIEASQQLTFDLAQSVIDRTRAAAELTDTPVDNKLADSLEVKLLNREIAAAQKAAQKAGLTIVEWKKAQIKVNQAIAARDNFLKGLKDANGGSGFSIEDLFKEALSQFNQFASNVSTSVTTPGGVRGAIGAGIAAQDPRLTKADQLKIAKAAETNDLLQKILDAQNGQSKDGTKARLIDDRDAITPRGAGVGHWTKAQAAAFAKVRSN